MTDEEVTVIETHWFIDESGYRFQMREGVTYHFANGRFWYAELSSKESATENDKKGCGE